MKTSKLRVTGLPTSKAEIEFADNNVHGAHKAFHARFRDHSISLTEYWDEKEEEWYELRSVCEACGTGLDEDEDDFLENEEMCLCRTCADRAITLAKGSK
jgi:hypothetical protein